MTRNAAAALCAVAMVGQAASTHHPMPVGFLTTVALGLVRLWAFVWGPP